MNAAGDVFLRVILTWRLIISVKAAHFKSFSSLPSPSAHKNDLRFWLLVNMNYLKSNLWMCVLCRRCSFPLSWLYTKVWGQTSQTQNNTVLLMLFFVFHPVREQVLRCDWGSAMLETGQINGRMVALIISSDYKRNTPFYIVLLQLQHA